MTGHEASCIERVRMMGNVQGLKPMSCIVIFVYKLDTVATVLTTRCFFVTSFNPEQSGPFAVYSSSLNYYLCMATDTVATPPQVRYNRACTERALSDDYH